MFKGQVCEIWPNMHATLNTRLPSKMFTVAPKERMMRPATIAQRIKWLNCFLILNVSLQYPGFIFSVAPLQ